MVFTDNGLANLIGSFVSAVLLFGFFVLAAGQGVVFAGDTEEKEPEPVDMAPVVVTATRIERSYFEVASSISVVSREEIEASYAKDIPDLLKSIEGIDTYDSSGVGTAGRLNMRGFWGGMSTHHLVLIDGIPQNRGEDKLVDWGLIPLDNVERIEVVRGPASSLYGDNAMSGVINIITREPQPAPETKLEASYGSFNTQNYTGYTSGIRGNTGYAFSGSFESTDGFRRHCDYEDFHVTGKLDPLYGERQDSRLSFGHHETTRGAYPWALTEAQVAEDRRQARPGTEHDTGESKKSTLGLTHRSDVGGISEIKTGLYYRKTDDEHFNTPEATEDSTKEYITAEDVYGLSLSLNTEPELLKMGHSITVGVDSERSDLDYLKYEAPYQVRGGILADYSATKTNAGLYAQDEIEVSENHRLILGIRFDSAHFDFIDHEDSAKSKKTAMEALSPNCGVVYKYKKESSLYAKIARAFRTPTLGQMFTYNAANPDLEAEEVMTYETGMRHRFGDRASGRLGFYYMSLDNEIWRDPAENIYKNYAESTHQGIEAGMDLRFAKVVTSFINYTYTEATNESGTDSGNYLAHVPEHSGSLGIAYNPDSGFGGRLIINSKGSSYLDSANTDKLPAYSTVDAKLFYKYKGWSAFLCVNNLLNETYSIYGYKDKSGVKHLNPAPGITATFGVRVNL